jgi:hypothetical protein
MAAQKLWKVEDVAHYLDTSVGWVYKRTAPNSDYTPKIPKVANIAHLRFDPEVIKRLFSSPAQIPGRGSLKIEQNRNLHLASTPSKRRFEKL